MSMSGTGGNVLLVSDDDQQIASDFFAMLARVAVSNFNETFGTSYLVKDFTIQTVEMASPASAGYTVTGNSPGNSNIIRISIVSEDIINLVFDTILTPVQPVSTPSTSFYPGQSDPGGLGYNGVNFTKVNNVQ